MATKKTTKIITKRDKLKLNYKDISVRALKTFAQAFVGGGAILASATDLATLKSALVAVAGSAISATVSAVWNSILVVRDR